MDFEVVYDILQKETELDNQVREKENAQIEKKVSFDISFVDPKDETKDLEPAE
jgi:hypothetical protein